MKRIGAIAAVTLLLSSCASGSPVETVWEIPISLTESQFAQGATLPVTATDAYAVVSGDDADGFYVRGFDLESGEQIWEVTASEPTECTAHHKLTLCSPTATRAATLPFFVDLATGDYEFAQRVLPNFYASDDAYLAERPVEGEESMVELVSAPFSASAATFLADAERVATLDVSTGEVDDGGHDALDSLFESGGLAPDSHWYGEVPPVPGAEYLVDGYMTSVSAANEEGSGTGIVFYDMEGNRTESRSIDASLHYTHNPATFTDAVNAVLDRAEVAAEEFPHVMIFQGGEVLGFEQVLTDSVAPAYSNIEAYRLENGVELDIGGISPESQTIWAYQYPYVSVSGVNDDGVFARTYDVTDGSTVVDGQKCQWAFNSTYCFDTESLRKVVFADN